MRRNMFWIVFVVAAAVIQTTWLGKIRIGGVLPDLVLLLVVFFAVADGEERAMFTGALGGLFQDVFADKVLGHHVLCYVVVGYAAGRIATRLITEHPAAKVVLVFCAGVMHGLLFAVISSIQDPANAHFLQTVGAKVLPATFYTALVTPIIFFLLARCFQRDDALRGAS